MVSDEKGKELFLKALPAHLASKIALSPHSLKSRADLLQLVAPAGSGAKRLALSFISPAKKVIWISSDWNLYAPLLWKMAEEKKIHLLGLDLSASGDALKPKKRLRFLWKLLLESRVFDGWILDSLRLTTAEGLFLQKLTRHHPVKILIVDEKPHLFCTRRAHLNLSHHHYRVLWSKGEKKLPEFFPSPLLQLFQGSDHVCLK
jgi:hypothetical protein